MKELLNRVEKIFELQDDRKYQKSVKTLLDKEASERKENKAKTTIFNIVYTEFSGNKMYSCYASTTEKSDIRKYVNKINKAEEFEDDLFKSAIGCIVKAAEYSKTGYYIDQCIDAIKFENKELKNPKIAAKIKTLTKDVDFNTKIEAILEMMNEVYKQIEQTINDKYAKLGKTVSKKIQSSLNQFFNLGFKAEKKLQEISTKSSKNDAIDAFNSVCNYLIYSDKFKEQKKEMDNPETKEKKKKEKTTKTKKKESKFKKLAAAIAALKLGKSKKKKTKKKFKLIRKPKSGKTKKAIDLNKNKAVKYVAGGIAVFIFASGIYALVKAAKPMLEQKPEYSTELDNNVLDTNDIIEEPKIEETVKEEVKTEETTKVVETEKPKTAVNSKPTDNNANASTIDKTAASIYQNWAQAGSGYTKEDIAELLKLLNGYESSITVSEADDMLIQVINDATIPAVNNTITNTQSQKVHKIELSDLFIDDDWAGIEAIEKMESYLNGTLTDPTNAKTYAQYAVNHQTKLVKGETVDGLNLSNKLNKPSVRLVYARAALGANAMSGVIDENLPTVDWQTLDNIAKSAKTDMGEMSKVYTK